MSNLTIGKIVNNSATIILNSTDQDGFGEKIVTGDSFTKSTTITPAGTYQVIADNFKTLAGYYSETFSNVRYGPIAARTASALVVGQFYAIQDKGTGTLNNAGVGTGATFVNDGAAIVHRILEITDAQLAQEPVAGRYYKCLKVAPAGFDGVAVQVEEQPAGTTFTPASLAVLDPDFPGTAYALSSIDYNNVDYRISIPNETSFPGKTRCLVKVEAISATGITSDESPLYVDIPEMAPHNLFIKSRRAIGMVFGGIWNPSSIIDCGVLGQSPFGQTLSVKLRDGANNSNIGESTIHTAPGRVDTLEVIGKFPTTIILRILFVTNEDLKEF